MRKRVEQISRGSRQSARRRPGAKLSQHFLCTSSHEKSADGLFLESSRSPKREPVKNPVVRSRPTRPSHNARRRDRSSNDPDTSLVDSDLHTIMGGKKNKKKGGGGGGGGAGIPKPKPAEPEGTPTKKPLLDDAGGSSAEIPKPKVVEPPPADAALEAAAAAQEKKAAAEAKAAEEAKAKAKEEEAAKAAEAAAAKAAEVVLEEDPAPAPAAVAQATPKKEAAPATAPAAVSPIKKTDVPEEHDESTQGCCVVQ